MTMIVYKVVTEDLKSLGLRNNPTILQYEVGVWVQSPTVVRNGLDKGGIWACRTRSGARTLRKYMKTKHGEYCCIFEAEIGEYLYGNTYRVKTDRIKLLREIDCSGS